MLVLVRRRLQIFLVAKFASIKSEKKHHILSPTLVRTGNSLVIPPGMLVSNDKNSVLNGLNLSVADSVALASMLVSRSINLGEYFTLLRL